MADFKTHLTIGSAVGFILATFSYVWQWVDNVLYALIVFLVTSIASFLPDMDSDSGLPVKIIFTIYGYFAAGVTVYYTYKQGLGVFLGLLLAAVVYFLVYVVIAKIFEKYTRHRGIFHSIPAALISFFLTLYLLKGSQIPLRTQFAIALGTFVGYLTHLILDEIWSLKYITEEEGRVSLRVKKSFGTALDFGFSGGRSYLAGLIAWALVFILFLLTLSTIKQIYFALLR